MVRMCIENHVLPTGEVIERKADKPMRPKGSGPSDRKETIYDQLVNALSKAKAA